MKAVVYVRFSPRKEEDERQSESNAFQLDACRRWCRDQGHEIVEQYADHALSGQDAQRPGLWSAIEALQGGYALVVYRLDRLARSVYLSEFIERSVKKRGAVILSATGEGTWADTNEDWLIRKVLQTFAEYERKVIAARTSAAMLRHQANGRLMCRWAPYGWKMGPINEKDQRTIVPDDYEQKVLRRMLTMAQNGATYTDIARILTAEGVQCRGLNGWHGRTVSRICKRHRVD